LLLFYGAWLGLYGLVRALCFGSLAAGVMILILLITKKINMKSQLPFAPIMFLGAGASSMGVMVILSGKAGSGKDTCGEYLVSLGFKRYAFADKLKEIARLMGWGRRKGRKGKSFASRAWDGRKKI